METRDSVGNISNDGDTVLIIGKESEGFKFFGSDKQV